MIFCFKSRSVRETMDVTSWGKLSGNVQKVENKGWAVLPSPTGLYSSFLFFLGLFLFLKFLQHLFHLEPQEHFFFFLPALRTVKTVWENLGFIHFSLLKVPSFFFSVFSPSSFNFFFGDFSSFL